MTQEATDTYKVMLTITSEGMDNMVRVKIDMDPDLDGEAIKGLGFFPASFEFAEACLLPALNKAYAEYVVDPMYQLEGPSQQVN